MRFTATITVQDESAEELYKVSLPEIQQSDRERTHTEISHTKDQVVFNIQAKDPIALKAITNTIIKIITVFDKMKTIRDDTND